MKHLINQQRIGHPKPLPTFNTDGNIDWEFFFCYIFNIIQLKKVKFQADGNAMHIWKDRM
ncbi:MAG: hypothetical protein IPH34_04270 [Chitinophagaceae bacterium]|nr:hypothetical protein [Chitinophagaceae bacterium]